MTNLNTLRLAHVQAHDFEAERTHIDPPDRLGGEIERGGGKHGPTKWDKTRQNRYATLHVVLLRHPSACTPATPTLLLPRHGHRTPPLRLKV